MKMEMKMNQEELNEQWKDILDYEGLYQVSTMGRVKSLNYHKTGKERVLKPAKISRFGHLCVSLYKNGNKKNFLVHRLVAEAFITNPDKKPYIDHLDCNPKNNTINNLRWATAKENSNNLLTIKNMQSTSRNKPVLQFSLDGNFIIEHKSLREAERQLGIYNSSRHICNCCKGKLKSAYGYLWRYQDPAHYIPLPTNDE